MSAGAYIMDDKRLDRIEAKLDDLTKVVTDMARVEERMITLFNRMDRYDQEQAAFDKRLGEIEDVTVRRGVAFSWLDRLIWIIIGAGAAYAMKQLGE